jgi:nucleotide-binding universal stress UspA family protein
MGFEESTAPTQIMVCVDGSETAYKAADFALALASKLGCQVYFVNVVGAETSEKNYNITADMVGSFERLGIEALRKCRDKADERNVRSEIVQLSGDPADEILRFAIKTKCGCIVMGRKGMTKLEKLLLGSVSEKVLNLSDAPVLIVK